MYFTIRARLSALNVKRDDDDDEEEGEPASIFDNMPDPDLVIENDTIFLKRSWIQDFLASRTKNQVENIQKKVTLTDAEKAERLLQRQIMEAERKKALKAAVRRAKMKKLNQIDEESGDAAVISLHLITTKKLESQFTHLA